MRTLQPVPHKACTVLELCAESIRDEGIKKSLRSLVPSISDAEAAYLAAGAAGTLFGIGHTAEIGGMTNAGMKKVYKETFVKSVRTRVIYDQILALPKHGICPTCGQNTVSTLDHYLAEVHHSALVVTPANLVPSCADCNKAKLHSQPTTAGEQTLHPYFDSVDDAVWLRAKVIESDPPTMRFLPDPPQTWSKEKRERVVFHFGKFKLGRLYATQSGAELTSISYALRAVAERAGPDGVRADLLSRARSAADDQPNSWRTAMYSALSASDWFRTQGVLILK